MTVRATPPANLSWKIFFNDPASPESKAVFLASAYAWPAALSFAAIVLFQLQFRLATSGARKRTVFPVCLLASLAMLLGLQSLSMMSNSAPGYALGVALGYMAMSRLYAVRMRSFCGVSIPWIIWRGNHEAVRRVNQLAAQLREEHENKVEANGQTAPGAVRQADRFQPRLEFRQWVSLRLTTTRIPGKV